ncbi:hypothetical protein PTKIN_Ptkin02bG0180100 [Pterospermum kingtungense]
MSEEGGHGSNFLLWENQSSSWPALCNYSDGNSAGTSTGSEEKKSIGGKNQREPLKDDQTKKKNTNKRAHGGFGKNGKGISSSTSSGGVGEGKVRGGGGGGGESDNHEMHIWTERERRKKLRIMFSNLHALLPQLSPKADKSTIVDEAVNYIKTLQQTLPKLQKQKLERLQGQGSNINFGFHKSPVITTQKQAFDSNSREAFLADQVSSFNDPADNISSINSLSVSQLPVLFQTWTSSNVVLNICSKEAQISVCSPKKPGLFTTICYVLEKHNIEVISAQVSSNSNRTMFMIQAHASTGGCNQLSEAFQVEEIQVRLCAGSRRPDHARNQALKYEFTCFW